ncbi:LysM peptidoglycan-binding domain-containing protein [Chryseobacterium sp. POE27]|uniref:CIS tube protein n=1 Tax=Chryseobacterium sp. POE27 TaxID=3138177 RepID=UPI00321970DC
MAGAIQKLTIGTYENSDYDKRIDSGAFKAFINPTGYSVTYKTELEPGQALGTAKADLKYVASPSTDLQLEFLFDGTGVTEAYTGNKLINKLKGKAFEKTSVKDQIDAFYKATGQVAGPIHKPYNVILNWGDFEFKGVLAEFTVEYKLFDNKGKPLRAVGKAKFSESISPKLEAVQKKNESPDVTHKRTVQAGDTLPLMTEKIYGDSKYYLEVAKINGLINFRQLIPGQELFFPPLEKTS